MPLSDGHVDSSCRCFIDTWAGCNLGQPIVADAWNVRNYELFAPQPNSSARTTACHRRVQSGEPTMTRSTHALKAKLSEICLQSHALKDGPPRTSSSSTLTPTGHSQSVTSPAGATLKASMSGLQPFAEIVRFSRCKNFP